MLNLYDISKRMYERMFLQLIAGCKLPCTLQHARDFRDLPREKSASVSLRMSEPAMPQEERAWRRGYCANDKLGKSSLLRHTLEHLAEDVLSTTSRKAPALVTATVPAADSSVRS